MKARCSSSSGRSSATLAALIAGRIRRDGPLTFAAFMDLALYHADEGYYARAARRTGRAGDFFTSVDVGPLYGELLAMQFAEMWRLEGAPRRFDLVEAGAADARLSRDVLAAAAARDPDFYNAIALRLVEASRAARAEQRAVLEDHAVRLVSSSADLEALDPVEGVIFANELLDALPCHAVAMTDAGLREIVVDVEGDRLVERLALPSTPRLAAALACVGARLEPGWRAEINLRASDWVHHAARRLARGFLLVIDYGHEAQELYSASHATGTRAAYRRHVTIGPGAGAPWLEAPGETDITADVDLTAIVNAATDEGLTFLGMLDQTYFLMGLLGDADLAGADLKRRLALKTLLMPGGLGSVMKVLIFGRGVGTPALKGLSYRVRLTA